MSIRTQAFACLFLMLPGLGVNAQESPREIIESALSQLEQARSYQWTTTESSDDARSRRPPSEGLLRSDGVIVVTSSAQGRRTSVVVSGDRAAVTNREGEWDSISLLDQSYQAYSVTATAAKAVRTPARELRELLEASDAPTIADEHFNVRLNESTIGLCLIRSNLPGISFRELAGTLRIFVHEGAIARYIVELQGLQIDGQRERRFKRSTEVAINGINSVDSMLPEGAEEALQRPLPESQPRLSQEDEGKLLSHYGKRGIGVHDPSSIVKCGESYWMFSTGNGVPSWTSPDLEHWVAGPSVFPQIPAWVTEVVPEQRGHFWAPDVILHRGRYLLYYSVSSFGVNTSAIALASTPTLDPTSPDYKWTDHGIVVRTSRTDDFNAIDPAVIATEGGELWMSFGSFWSGLKLIQLDPETGKRSPDDSMMHSIAWSREIEAPFIFERDGWFYLFFNKGKCCRGVASTYEIHIGRSRTITGPYLDRDGVELSKDGGSLFLDTDGPMIGPGHANILKSGDRYLFHFHYYDGTERGRSMFAISELKWDSNGWPVPQV
ncbi:MAG: arabinan endo-1,5-alpha-L-arabinosidase [Planctomyces sp.]|nr:arabinan endo-1,5-alpha-L-arabinosidase [Planctomyces sp.]